MTKTAATKTTTDARTTKCDVCGFESGNAREGGLCFDCERWAIEFLHAWSKPC